MVEPNLIIKGDASYTLEEFFAELKDTFGAGIKKLNKDQKDKSFKSLFMFILLSSEDKPAELMMKVFNMSKEQVADGQEAFGKEIEVARAIQMKKYLDLYTEYLGGQSITLKLLNLWIKEFLNKYIKEEDYGTT